MSDFWSSFVPQLLATVCGALIGVASVIIVFRLERRAAADDAFDQSVERLLLRLDELAGAVDGWQKIANVSSWQVGDRPPAHPYPGRVSIAIELTRLKASPADRVMLTHISSAWDTIAQSHGAAQSAACGLLAGAVVKWQGGASSSAVLSALRVAERVSVDGLSTNRESPTDVG